MFAKLADSEGMPVREHLRADWCALNMAGRYQFSHFGSIEQIDRVVRIRITEHNQAAIGRDEPDHAPLVADRKDDRSQFP